jgi:hypothetical protein
VAAPAKRLGWFGRAWVAATVAYALVRAAIVWPTLGGYGVSPVVFLLIDVGTAWPYAVGQVRIIQSIRATDWPQAQLWALVTLLSFLAPYVYIVGAGSGELPTLAYVIVGALVVILGGTSVARIARMARRPVAVDQ